MMWISPKLGLADAFAVIAALVLFVVAMVVWSSSSGDVKYPSNDP